MEQGMAAEAEGSAVAPATPAGSAWSPLRHSLFRALWIATVASHIGSYMTDVGQGWLMTTLAPSPLFVALMMTAESLPYFLLGLPAGALADIVDRRRLLLVTQTAMAAGTATLAVITLLGLITPWGLLGLAVAVGAATALNDPAWQAVPPEMLPAADLPAGITLNGVGVNIARTIGPAAGGAIVAAFGPGAVFVLDSLSFVGVMIVLLRWKRARAPSILPAERLASAMRIGLRFARYGTGLGRVLVRTFAFMSCGVVILALMPLLAQRTGQGAVALGFLLGSMGVGAVIGAGFLPRIRARLTIDTMIAAHTIVFAAVCAAVAFVESLFLLCPILIVGGFAWIVVVATLNVTAQQASPAWVKARALAVYLVVFQAGIAAGSALWGWVATRANLAGAYACAAIGLLLGLSLSRYRLAVVEGLDHSPTHHWPDPSVTGDQSPEAGPVMVEIQYRVDTVQAEVFIDAMQPVGRMRRRHGAVQWWLFRDSADPTCFIEIWVNETWADHLREHERVSVEDRGVEQHAFQYTIDRTLPATRHYLPAYRCPRTTEVPSVPTARKYNPGA
jgi:MFS family permease